MSSVLHGGQNASQIRDTNKRGVCEINLRWSINDSPKYYFGDCL